MKDLRVAENGITRRETVSFKKYLAEIAKIPLLTHEEEIVYCLKAKDGDEGAMKELVRRNLRFVVSVGNYYASDHHSIEDLVNEGNIGLIEAIKTFDITLGNRFLSYAVWHIRKCMTSYISHYGRTVRLPISQISGISKLNRKRDELEQELGDTVTIQDIIPELRGEYTEKELYVFNTFSKYYCYSLDKPLNETNEGDFTLNDKLVDKYSNINDPDYIVIESNVKEEINRILQYLKPRDIHILTDIYGLDGKTPMTLYHIGLKMGITSEMVRKRKEKSLLRLNKLLKNSDIMEYC